MNIILCYKFDFLQLEKHTTTDCVMILETCKYSIIGCKFIVSMLVCKILYGTVDTKKCSSV